MFLGDKLCRKKTLFICSFLVFCFCCLFSVFFSSPVSAQSINIRSFDVRMSTGGDYMWKSNILYNQYITDNGVPPTYVKSYQFYTSDVNVTGNYATIHFETNFVFSGPTSLPYIGAFVNTSYIDVIVCSASGSSNLSIRQSHINTNETSWTGPAPTINGKNKTLTIYGDVVLSGLTTGTQNFVCLVGSNQYNFYSATNNNLPNFYIEQQPTSIDFTNDESEALLRDQIDAINNVSSSINNLSETLSNQDSDYDKEKADLEDKQSEVEDDIDDLSLSASSTGNPLFNWFVSSNSNACRTLSTVGAWFGNPNMQICSPYPSSIRGILGFVSSLFFSAILIRLYYKKLKGGVDG